MANARQFMAARTAAWAKSGGWVNPYVTDGLVAMWDGEWNVGPGVHDPNANAMVDICGNYHGKTVSGEITYGDNYINFDGSTQFDTTDYTDGGQISLEIVGMNLKPDGGPCGFIAGAADSASGETGSPYFYMRLPNKTRCAAGSWLNADVNTNVGDKFHQSICWSADFLSVYTYGALYRVWQHPYTSSGTNPFSFGGCNFSFYGSSPKFLGRIYCFRIYHRKISDQEVAANYAVDKARFGLP